MLSHFEFNRTFLHFAILADAPRVAGHLLKHGAGLDETVGDYPDLTQLCLSLGQSHTDNQQELDSALVLASTYALPRTTRFLLAKGANPTSKRDGIDAIQAAVTPRPPFETSSIILWQTDRKHYDALGHSSTWAKRITDTVLELLKAGGVTFDADLGNLVRDIIVKVHTPEQNAWELGGGSTVEDSDTSNSPPVNSPVSMVNPRPADETENWLL